MCSHISKRKILLTVIFGWFFKFSLFFKISMVNKCFTFKNIHFLKDQVHCVMYLFVYFICLYFNERGSRVVSRYVPRVANSWVLSNSLGSRKHFYVHIKNENILVSL